MLIREPINEDATRHFSMLPVAAAGLRSSVRLVDAAARPRPPRVESDCFAFEAFLESLLRLVNRKNGSQARALRIEERATNFRFLESSEQTLKIEIESLLERDETNGVRQVLMIVV